MRVTLIRIPRMIPMISTRLMLIMMLISLMTPIVPTIPASGKDAPGNGEQTDDG
jgi:hypothetical protein